MLTHPFEPVFDARSRVLILGSFPSVRSRQEGFYYGHPRNRFWRVIAYVTGEEVPGAVEEKKRLLLRHRIALWDAAQACEIKGSADAAMTQVIPNDLSRILCAAPIAAVFANGQTAGKIASCQGIIPLPSTSPANAAYSLPRLQQIWKSALSPYL